MLAVILTVVGFFLGIKEGINIALLGAGVGYCVARGLEGDVKLREAVAALEKEVASLKVKLRTLSQASPEVRPAAEAAAPVPKPRSEPVPAPVSMPAAMPEPELSFELSIDPEPLPAPAAAAPPIVPWPDATGAKPAEPSTEPQPQPKAEPQSTPPRRPAPVPAKPAFNPLAAAWGWLFGGNTLVRVGVVILFFGLAFLIKFAAERTVVPIEVRYIGIAIGALVALVLGWRLREKRPGYAMALQGLAVAVFYLTLFASYRLHQLLPGGLVMALLVATCALSAMLAVLQDSRSLAVIGICGGFMAPILASTGGGSHVALFSYYALLNAGILGIAWFKAWRPLNVLGFLFTLAIAGAWGQRSYHDDLFASTEPFLLLFFAFYLIIALLYARRRHAEISEAIVLTVDGERIDYVDGTLVFGVPLAFFGLQYAMVRDMPFGTALSALGLGAVYIPLAWLMWRRGAEQTRLMVESFLALGVIFGSLAIPLALDAEWTAAAWAVEGAGIFWVCCRQHRPVGRAFGLLLQFGAGVNYLSCLHPGHHPGLLGEATVLQGPVLGALLLGISGLVSAYVARKYLSEEDGETGGNHALDHLATIWGLVGLALVPLLLFDLRWAGTAWALCGVLAFWLYCRTPQPSGRLVALLLQVLAGAMFLHGVRYPGEMGMFGMGTTLEGPLLGALIIGCAGVLTGRMARTHIPEQSQGSWADDLGILWGLSFLALSPLLLLDLRWSAVTWVVMGLAALVIGLRHGRLAAPLFGTLLQLAAGLVLFDQAHADPGPAILNFSYLSALLLSAAGFASGLALARSGRGGRACAALAWSLLWWGIGGSHELYTQLEPLYVQHAHVLAAGLSALLLLALARVFAWSAPRMASLLLLPLLILLAYGGAFTHAHPAAALGWLAWPIAMAALYIALARQDESSAGLLPPAHILALWLLTWLGAREGWWDFRDLGEAGSAWPIFGRSLVPLALLWLLSRPSLLSRWPLDAFPGAYRLAAAPIALGTWLWLFGYNLQDVGGAAPLPYLPLLNPLDLAVAGGLLVLLAWLRSLPGVMEGDSRRIVLTALAASGFLWLNGMLLRSLHHWAGLEYRFDAIMQSTLAQAALALFWSVLALALMLYATRSSWRGLWLTGGGLMAVVVAKLFLVDLSRVGTVERIVTFIGVGLLLLVIGYFSPVPPKREMGEMEENP